MKHLQLKLAACFLHAKTVLAKHFVLVMFILLPGINALAHPCFSKAERRDAVSVPMVRLQMSGPLNFSDETVIYYQAGATAGFDAAYDAYKLMGPNPAPHISQEYDSVLMAINGIEAVNETFTINIKATTNISGNFTITVGDFDALPKNTDVYLKDRLTGATVNILKTPYTFSLQDTAKSQRFILYLVKNNPATGTGVALNAAPAKLSDRGNNQFAITVTDNRATGLFVSLVPLDGKNTIEHIAFVNGHDLLLDLSMLSPGIYILCVGDKDQSIMRSKILIR